VVQKLIFQWWNSGHLGFMQIIKVAQSCRLGNQAEIVVGPHGSSNPSKNFIGKNISRSKQNQVDYKQGLKIKQCPEELNQQ